MSIVCSAFTEVTVGHQGYDAVTYRFHHWYSTNGTPNGTPKFNINGTDLALVLYHVSAMIDAQRNANGKIDAIVSPADPMTQFNATSIAFAYPNFLPILNYKKGPTDETEISSQRIDRIEHDGSHAQRLQPGSADDSFV